MPETGYSLSPKVMRGALVQLVEDVIGIVPNIIPFQYNPETVSRKVEPWNPFEVDQTNRGAQAPTVQPYDPEETFSFTLVFHAADGLEDGDPLVTSTGVASRLAALRKLTEPSQGLIGDLINTEGADPDVFKCTHSIPTDIAVAAYNLTRLQEDALAIANIANAVSAARCPAL